MEITVLCLAVFCVYNYLCCSKVSKRVFAMESSLDELGQTAAGAGSVEGHA